MKVTFTFAPVGFHRCHGSVCAELRRTGVYAADAPLVGAEPFLEGEIRITVEVGADDPTDAIRQAAAMVGIAVEPEAEE